VFFPAVYLKKMYLIEQQGSLTLFKFKLYEISKYKLYIILLVGTDECLVFFVLLDHSIVK